MAISLDEAKCSAKKGTDSRKKFESVQILLENVCPAAVIVAKSTRIDLSQKKMNLKFTNFNSSLHTYKKAYRNLTKFVFYYFLLLLTLTPLLQYEY